MSPQKNTVSGLQLAASVEACKAEGESLPYPPDGYPAVSSVAGASVLGYAVKETLIREHFGPDGKRRYPGDEGFTAAVCSHWRASPMPTGWRCEDRSAPVLYAIVDGNPILLESLAKESGYPRAIAIQGNLLELGEIVLDRALNDGGYDGRS